MLKKQIILAVALLLTVTGSAFALSKPGLYIGTELGASVGHYDDKSDAIHNAYGVEVLPGASVSNDNFSPRVDIGYQWNNYLALELGYSYLGEVEYKHIYGVSGANSTLTQQAVDLMAKLMLPLGDKFNVYALGGGVYLMGSSGVNKEAEALGLRARGGATSIRPAYGLGAGYDLTPKWSLTASWRRYTEGAHFSMTDFFGGGVAYHF